MTHREDKFTNWRSVYWTLKRSEKKKKIIIITIINGIKFA